MTEGEKFALVVVPAPLKEPLVYSIPKALEGHLKPGTRVLIPLQKRTVTGIVIEVVGASPVAKTKSIVAPLDEEPIFDHHLLKLARWIAQYYLASLGEVIATMLPAKSRRQSQKTITLEKTEY